MEKKEQKEVKREMKKIDVGQIIWSADVDILELGRALRGQALPRGTVVKLDRLFFETCEKREIIEYYQQELGYPIFVDAKIIEIPSKCLAIAETYLKHKPFMLNIMAGACSTGIFPSKDPNRVDCLKQFADVCAAAGTKSCGVTVLTSKDSDYVREEFLRHPEDQVEWYATEMLWAGLTDIVCSPEEAMFLREDEDFDEMTINTPGVRLPGTDVRDQARVTTPAEALDNGADRLVIGSNLTDGEGDIVDRLKRNYERLLKHLEENGYEVVELEKETPEQKTQKQETEEPETK